MSEFKKCARHDVRVDENGFITGVLSSSGELCGVYKWNKRQNCYTNVLPLTEAAFKSGLYRGSYVIR